MSFPRASLESLCELIIDCPHSTPKWTDYGVLVLRNQNIRNGRLDLSSPSFTDERHYEGRIKRAEPREGDLVFTREAPMGEVCQIPKGLRCCLGQRQVLLRVNKQNDSRFMLYAIQSPVVQHEIGWNEGTGSTVSNVRIPVLKTLSIPRPALQEQREIAETLRLLDDKIELNRQTARTLEELSQRLFKSWFVDFDPVRAKMAGHQPAHTPPEIADLFPDRLVDSPLGPVPEAWESAHLGDVAENVRDSVKAEEVQADETYVGLEHFAPKSLTLAQVGRGEEITSNKSRFKKGDLLFGKLRPYFHKISAAHTNGICSTDVLVIRPKSEVSRYYVYLSFFQESVVDYVTQRSTGTRMPRANWKTLSQFPIALPPEEVRKAFGALVFPMMEKMFLMLSESERLAALRDRLLPKLISGEVRVPEGAV